MAHFGAGNLVFTLKAHLSLVFCLLQTQYGHTLQIPGQADEVPFALGSSQAAHRELTKAHDRLDDHEDRFDGWRNLATTFEEDLREEYAVAAKAHIDFYLQYMGRIASGDHAAMLDAPVITRVVESMVRRLLRQGTPADDCLRICAQFLMQSEHFKQTPHQLLSARMHATMKLMLKSGNFTNKTLALRKFNGYFYDVEHISTYAPYCDAIVMDQLMADLVRKSTVNLEERYGTRVFILNNWPEFLEWLDSLEQGITPEHQAGLSLAYPGLSP